MDFFPEVELNREQVEAMARALYAVAKTDGLHEREAGLIASFWIDAGGGAATLSELERAESPPPSALAGVLHTDAERQLFLKTALLLTWADGKVTDAERAKVNEYAQALGVDATTLANLESGVKDYLLGHLVHVQNVDAVLDVAKKLGV
jgi:tellurite resistance protein